MTTAWDDVERTAVATVMAMSWRLFNVAAGIWILLRASQALRQLQLDVEG
ncbi:hypothetical protein ABAC460_03060 [Asticcacaulis sp. AC460]|nr:hypothetical protein [Asticcacaulis sp. AC460]ESQ92489.1 hypothetical protein ABAC460_03060 [Asticcacaulis sp. AC460]